MASGKKIAAALCSIGMLVACGQEAGTTAAPVEAPVEGVRVELITAGSAPLQPLVWFTDSDEQKITYSLTRGLEQHTETGEQPREASGTPSPQQAPDSTSAQPTSTPLGSSSTQPTASEGSAPEDFNVPYEEVTLSLPLSATIDTDGQTRSSTVTVGTPTGNNEQRNGDIATAEGFIMTSQHDKYGRTQKRSFAAPEKASDSARASVEEALMQMNNLPIVFPEQPLGTGAQWKVSNRVDDGASLLQDITYTLVKRQNKTATLAVSVQRRPATQTLAGTDLSIIDVHSTSSGRMTVNLTHALPERGSVSVETTVTYGQQGSPVRVIQTSTTKSSWE